MVNPKRRRRRAARSRNAATPKRTNARRHYRRRRTNPVMRRTVAVNPRRRRRSYSRRRNNPSSIRIGKILKDMVWGAGGAMLTRIVAGVVTGFIPAQLMANPFGAPAVEAAVAVFGVRWGVKHFFGQAQADVAMLGGLISAGLKAIDALAPGLEGQLTGIIRLPVQLAPGLSSGAVAAAQQGAAQGAAQALNGFRDVEEVPNNIFGGGFGGFGDVEELDPGFFPGTAFE